ncbi:MAG: SDR family NAD(P)-dependent oxidoreductase [Bacteroidales bacterium]|nr:SDR family NAD(P)-dependent oxidoreductase [Bacteroidales bacterium]MDD4702815.1 SDR family NAD(P)-dependent oxidoreductase [Bacteroidales bacterium]
MKGIVCITGATSGIGYYSAIEFAKLGYDIIITGRRKERLDELEKLIREEYKVKVISLNFDVRERNCVEDCLNFLPSEWKDIDILVNNAGLAAGKEPIFEGDHNDWEQMIDTNVKGLLYVSRVIIPWMKGRKKGHILNICSIAGKEVYKDGAVYCASKAAVNSISQGMRIDCNPYNIKVTNICPGAVDTEFSIVRFKGDKAKADATYQGYTPLTGEDIAKTIIYCATLPQHVCINDLVITPTAQANATTFHRE